MADPEQEKRAKRLQELADRLRERESAQVGAVIAPPQRRQTVDFTSAFKPRFTPTLERNYGIGTSPLNLEAERRILTSVPIFGGIFMTKQEREASAQAILNQGPIAQAFTAVGMMAPGALGRIPQASTLIPYGRGLVEPARRTLERIGTVPTGKVATALDPTVAKLITVVKQAKPLERETRALQSAERSARVAKSAPVLEAEIAAGKGREAFLEARKYQKGELPRASFEAPGLQLTPEEQTSLYTKIGTTEKFAQRYYTRDNAAKALDKVLTGVVPARYDIALLEQVFGSELATILLAQRPLYAKVWDEALDAINIPRAVKASWDLSAPLRQGIAVSVGHPVISARSAFVPMLRAFAKERYAQAYDDVLRNDPLFPRFEQAKLYYGPLVGKAAGGAEREELYRLTADTFFGRVARAFPLVRASERAYITYLNGLRHGILKNTVQQSIAKGAPLSDEQLAHMAEFLNVATGRGRLYALERYSDILSAGFWSPRLVASRFETPLYLFSRDSAVRKEAARDLAAFVGTGIGILTLVKYFTDAEVELDPRSSDFGKIQIGDTRIDFWGGFQPIVRYATQLVSGERKTTGEGQILPADRNQVVLRFLRSKLSPAVATAVDIRTGESFIGEEPNLDITSTQGLAFQQLAPLFVQDLVEAFEAQGTTGALIASPSLFGVGITTFNDDLQAARDRETALRGWKDAEGKSITTYEQANKAQRELVDQSATVERILTAIHGRQEPKVQEKLSVALDRYPERKTELEAQLRGQIDMGIAGDQLRDAIQSFKDARYQAAQTLFGPDVSAELDKRAAQRGILEEDVLAEQYWTTPVPIDPISKQPDFAARDAERRKILEEAQPILEAKGLSTDYITGSGPYTYRGNRFADTTVASIVQQYEEDIEYLRQNYWRVRDEGLRLLFEAAPDLEQSYKKIQGEQDPVRQRFILTRTQTGVRIAKVLDDIARVQEAIRQRSYEVERRLYRWGYITSPKNPQLQSEVGLISR